MSRLISICHISNRDRDYRHLDLLKYIVALVGIFLPYNKGRNIRTRTLDYLD